MTSAYRRYAYAKKYHGVSMLTDWSTFKLPHKTDFADLYDAINSLYMPSTPFITQNPTVSGTYRKREIGDAKIIEVTADGHGLKRNRSDVNRSDGEFCSFKFLLSGYGAIEQEGKTSTFKAGDIITLDNSYPYRISCYDRFSFLLFIVPRLLVYPRTINPKAIHAGLIPADSSISSILHGYVKGLLELKGNSDICYSSSLTDMLCGLIAVALDPGNEKTENNQQSVNHMRFNKLTDYIRSHLSDPELSPAAVADVCGISVRYLHKLFEPHGISFSRWVLKQRLERCREQIVDPRFIDKNLSHISYNWGFNNFSHFIRVFRSEYGLSPRDYRKQGRLKNAS